MKETERKALRANFDRLCARGLKDIKFFLVNVGSATVEDVCHDVNAFLLAIDQGKSHAHAWNDTRGRKTATT